MKNTDPPHSNSHKLKLTPDLLKFIHSMGVYFESYGISRIGGLILGLLMVAHEPLSAEEIASILKVSRASVSTNFPILLTSGLAEKVAMHGDRTTYYGFPATAWELAIQVSIQSVITLRRLAEQGLTALRAGDSARTRLQKTIEFCDMQIEYNQKMIDDWRARQRKPVKVTSSASRRTR
jgi:DNA-binding transcriptional regulator GbsR (MarR family)